MEKIKMKAVKTIITLTGIFILIVSSGYISGESNNPGVSVSEQTSSKSKQTTSVSKQTTSKTKQTTTKPKQAVSKTKQTVTKPKTVITKPVQSKKIIDVESVTIGSQKWALANLNVSTFRNGDSIPEAKTNAEWKKAGDEGKPAWCYYNNDPAYGKKYGKLYNWYAVNDPRELAPAGWSLASDADWIKLTNSLGGQAAAGTKLKSIKGWTEGNNGTNETGFNGLPGGYRIENGTFQNAGNSGIWWSSTENNTLSAFDHYLVLSGSLSRSNSPKQRGSSVRCLR